MSQTRKLEVGAAKGAQFWAYISPSNDTADVLTDWEITLTQKDGNWTGKMSKTGDQHLQTPGLSGEFDVKVVASGKGWGPTELQASGSPSDIGCNANCASMVGIVASKDGKSATYWTTWDAFCSQ
ncbi:MAG: hypothetical protein ABL308_07300 [Oceanicaulis sp.]